MELQLMPQEKEIGKGDRVGKLRKLIQTFFGFNKNELENNPRVLYEMVKLVEKSDRKGRMEELEQYMDEGIEGMCRRYIEEKNNYGEDDEILYL